MEQFRALIFDVDGTMAETEDLHRLSFNDAFAHFGLPWVWDQDLYRRLLAVTGGKDRISHFHDTLCGDGVMLTSSQVADVHRHKTARYAERMANAGCPLRPGVTGLIKSARAEGRDLAIATTTSRANIEALLKPALGRAWNDLFKVIVAGEDVERKKPDSEVYVRALAGLELPAPSCLAFEDSRNGFLSARSAGIPVVVSLSMYFDHENFDGAFRVVHSLEQFALDQSTSSALR